MKKRWLSLALALVFCLSLAPAVTPSARAATNYDLWLGGVRVTSENAADILGDGTASYDAARSTLTLENCVVSGQGYNGYLLYSSLAALTIELKGQNALIGGNGINTAIIYMSNGNTSTSNTSALTVIGSGSLVASGGSSEYGVNAIEVGSLTFGNSFVGTMIVNGGTATNSSSSISGIFVSGTLTVQNGTVIATGGSAPKSYGINAGSSSGSVAVSGGVLIAQGGNATSESYGVSSNSINLTGGAVVMRAGLVDNGLTGTRQACSSEPVLSNMRGYNYNSVKVYVPNSWDYINNTSDLGNNLSLTGDACYVISGPSPITTAATSINTNGKTLLCVNLYEGAATTGTSSGLTASGDTLSITGGGKVIAAGGINGYSSGLTTKALTIEGSGTEVIGVGGPATGDSLGYYNSSSG